MVALTHQVFAVVFSGDGNRRANGNIVRMSQDYHGGFSWLDNFSNDDQPDRVSVTLHVGFRTALTGGLSTCSEL